VDLRLALKGILAGIAGWVVLLIALPCVGASDLDSVVGDYAPGFALFVISPFVVGMLADWGSRGKIAWYVSGIVACAPVLAVLVHWMIAVLVGRAEPDPGVTFGLVLRPVVPFGLGVFAARLGAARALRVLGAVGVWLLALVAFSLPLTFLGAGQERSLLRWALTAGDWALSLAVMGLFLGVLVQPARRWLWGALAAAALSTFGFIQVGRPPGVVGAAAVAATLALVGASALVAGWACSAGASLTTGGAPADASDGGGPDANAGHAPLRSLEIVLWVAAFLAGVLAAVHFGAR